MAIPYEVKKKLVGGYAVHYGCPRCSTRLVSSLREAGTQQPCPDCGHAIQVPGEVEAREIIAKRDAEKAQKREDALRRKSEEEELAMLQRMAASVEQKNVAVEREKERIEQDKRRPYDYYMVPISRSIGRNSSPDEIAAYIRDIVYQYGGKGWEFFRIDQVEVDVPPGCLMAFFGYGSIAQLRSFITFRKRKD